jgi:hypothetical protein
MRFPVRDLNGFKALAKKLKRALQLGHGHSLEQLALAHGYQSYNELFAVLKRSGATGAIAPRSLDPELWLVQLSDAFRTEFDPVICGRPAKTWLIWICGVSEGQLYLPGENTTLNANNDSESVARPRGSAFDDTFLEEP